MVATGQVIQTLWNLCNGSGEYSAVERYSTWQVKDSMASNERLLGLLLALFGIIALVAARSAIAKSLRAACWSSARASRC